MQEQRSVCTSHLGIYRTTIRDTEKGIQVEVFIPDILLDSLNPDHLLELVTCRIKAEFITANYNYRRKRIEEDK